MDKKYAFSTVGVAKWQADLNAGPLSKRQAEAELVAKGLQGFLPLRFCLTAQQVAYLDGLNSGLCQVWAAQLAYAIRSGIPISLEKPGQNASVQPMNTKYIESEERNGTGQPNSLSADDGDGYYLCFSIGY